MSKILLFLFGLQPLISCAYVCVVLFNSYKITEGISYLCVVGMATHYLIMGLKETLKS